MVAKSRSKFMENAIDSYQQAVVLLGHLSQLKDFTELQGLIARLTEYRSNILVSYVDILPVNVIKILSISPQQTTMYRKGICRYYKTRNYIVYSYKQKLYDEMEHEAKSIDKIKSIVDTIVQLDGYYDIYDELIADLQKKNVLFASMMQKHMSEYIYL